MSAASTTRRLSESVRIEARADPISRSREAVTVRWRVSREALRAALLHSRELLADGEELLVAREGPDPELCIQMLADDAALTASILDPLTGRELTLAASAPAMWILDDDLIHVDAGGFLRATLTRAGETLYAQTSLLARLGVPGGRYQVLSFAPAPYPR